MPPPSTIPVTSPHYKSPLASIPEHSSRTSPVIDVSEKRQSPDLDKLTSAAKTKSKSPVPEGVKRKGSQSPISKLSMPHTSQETNSHVDSALESTPINLSKSPNSPASHPCRDQKSPVNLKRTKSSGSPNNQPLCANPPLPLENSSPKETSRHFSESTSPTSTSTAENNPSVVKPHETSPVASADSTSSSKMSSPVLWRPAVSGTETIPPTQAPVSQASGTSFTVSLNN